MNPFCFFNGVKQGFLSCLHNNLSTKLASKLIRSKERKDNIAQRHLVAFVFRDNLVLRVHKFVFLLKEYLPS